MMLTTTGSSTPSFPLSRSQRSSFSSSEEALHRRLALFNERRLRPSLSDDEWRENLVLDTQRRLEEGEFIERERRALRGWAAEAPTDPDAFVAWFSGLKACGPGQNDSLFPWLATSASLDQLRWFLAQEVSGEAGFEDLVALTQLKLPAQIKLELSRNYWDEMGRGHPGGMHGPMLTRLAEELALPTGDAHAVWETLALANLLTGLAINRRYSYQSLGALGVVELTAPARAEYVNTALKRLNVLPEARRYYALHATLDVKHSESWNQEILLPLVAADPRLAQPLAEGALLRLRAGARSFRRYRIELGLPA